MTTHHAKIPRFHCSYFRPCVCVPLFGPGGPVFKVCMVISVELGWCNKFLGKFRIFVVAISSLCVCATWRDRSHVKIPHFHCGYFRLVCVCVCMCVCIYVLQRATRQSHMKILCFHCGYFRLCVFVCSAFCLDWARLASRCSSIVGISESELNVFPVASCHILQF